MSQISRPTETMETSSRDTSDASSVRIDLREPQVVQIRESKLRPIVPRHGDVPRRALLDRLSRANAPVAVVVAPAGYGKTTLLAQWADRAHTAVGWLTMDESDNDPTALCTYLAAALDRLEPRDASASTALAPHLPASARRARLHDMLHRWSGSGLIIIDHLESVTNPECLDLIGAIAIALPEDVHLVLSSRVQPRLPTARLRVEGRLLEIGAQDLALDLEEAAALLLGAGVDPADADAQVLVDQTEGWPAGLYLAALAMQVGDPGPASPVALSGDSRFLGDYLQAEILDELSPEDAAFLLRTSVLDSLSGALCDATLDVSGSALRLRGARRPERAPRSDWTTDASRIRYHRLFGELLQSELQRREPALVPLLHARAATWFEANGQPEHALHHALAANDADQVALLVERLMQPVWASGRLRPVMRWLDWIADDVLLGQSPSARSPRRARCTRSWDTPRWPKPGQRPPNGRARRPIRSMAAPWKACSRTSVRSCVATGSRR